MSSWRVFLMHMLMSAMPATRCFAFKRALLRWAGAEIGANVRIASSARFYVGGHLSIGDDTWIGHDVLILGGGASIVVGAKVDVGPRVVIVTGTHQRLTEDDRAAGTGYSLPVTICHGAWIGACATILGGVRIGSKATVAAGAVVREDVADLETVGGVPARRLDRAHRQGGNW